MYIPSLIQDLFDWRKMSSTHSLIKDCAFHYEFESIHQFADGTDVVKSFQ